MNVSVRCNSRGEVMKTHPPVEGIREGILEGGAGTVGLFGILVFYVGGLELKL